MKMVNKSQRPNQQLEVQQQKTPAKNACAFCQQRKEMKELYHYFIVDKMIFFDAKHLKKNKARPQVDKWECTEWFYPDTLESQDFEELLSYEDIKMPKDFLVNTKDFYLCQRKSCLRGMDRYLRVSSGSTHSNIQDFVEQDVSTCQAMRRELEKEEPSVKSSCWHEALKAEKASLLDLLSLAYRARSLACGTLSVELALQKKQALALWVAEDASSRQSKEWFFQAKKLNIPILQTFTKEELGKCTENTYRSCLVLLQENFLLPLLTHYKRYINIQATKTRVDEKKTQHVGGVE